MHICQWSPCPKRVVYTFGRCKHRPAFPTSKLSRS